MKLCPQCEFIYEDDQSLCDMDGRELVCGPGPLAFEESTSFTSAQLQPSAAAALVLRPRPAAILAPGLPSGLPSRWQSRSYTVAAVAGLLLAMLLFVFYYARTHRSQSDNRNQSQYQSYDQSTSREPGAQHSPSDPVSASESAAETASTEQSSGQLTSPDPTLLTQSPPSTLSPAAEKSLNGVQAPGPASVAATNRSPVVIQLTNGGSIKADEAWERRDGIWYRQGSMINMLKRSEVKSIQRPAPPSRRQQSTGRPQTSIAQNQPRINRTEVPAAKKESKVSSFLKKTGQILKRPFKF